LYSKYLQANPADVPYNLELGNYYIELRRWRRALQHFEELLKITPNHVDYVERYTRILAACPNPQFRNPRQALEFAERLSVMYKFTEDQEIRAAMTVAVTFAELKDFEKALKIVNDNLSKLQNKNLDEYSNSFAEMQKSFQANKPYRL